MNERIMSTQLYKADNKSILSTVYIKPCNSGNKSRSLDSANYVSKILRRYGFII